MTGLQKEALKIANRLRSAGHTVLYAGGCVRDYLRNIPPKDMDIATSATPGEVLKLFPKGNSIGAHFGVILAKSGAFFFEIATFREDGVYLDGRRPSEVHFSSPECDALRRDFTINGLFQDPWTGEIRDYVGGQNDLQKRIIRAIGNPVERFEEDSLRLMRAVRFATVTGFTIEPVTWTAVCDLSNWLGRVSIERIREEFTKILISANRARGIDLLMQSGLMKWIIPELYDLQGCEQPPQWHPEGDVYTHTRIMLEMLGDNPDLELALAVLLHDIGKPPAFSIDEGTGRIRFSAHDSIGAEMTNEILRSLKFSNQVIANVREMVANHMKFMHVQEMRPARLRRFMSRPTFLRELELHRLDCASSNGFTDNEYFLREKLDEYAHEALLPAPLVSGRDLLNWGLPPGPSFKEWLEEIQTEQLEGRLGTRLEALQYLAQLTGYKGKIE